MEIEVNINKRYLLIIFSTLIVFATAFIVYASDPSILGHPASEISGFPDCLDGQSLTHNSSGFFCIASTSIGGSSFDNLDVDTLNVTSKFYSGYEIVHTYNSDILYASCPAGKKIISCLGYVGNTFIFYHLINETTCSCSKRQTSLSKNHCYAICARIS
jgi:hypothetical protein